MTISSGLWASIQKNGNPTNRSACLRRYGLLFEGAKDLWMSMFCSDRASRTPGVGVWYMLFDTYDSADDAKRAAVELNIPPLERVEIIDLLTWLPVGCYSGSYSVKSSLERDQALRAEAIPPPS